MNREATRAMMSGLLKALRSLLIATGIAVTVSCESDSPSGPDTEGPIEQISLECEVRGFPCSLSEVPLEILERGEALGDEALAMLESGASTSDAAAFLEGQADMAEVEWDQKAIWFRLEGGAGIWILSEGAFSPEIFSPGASSGRVAPQSGPRFHIVGPESEDKTALVLSPFLWEFGQEDDGPPVRDILSTTRGYENGVTFRANSEKTARDVTLESFMEWGNYDVVHVVTHGTRICDPEGCRGMLVAGTLESALPAGPETEAEKLKSLAETGVSYAKGVRGLVLELDLDGYLVLNADFFRKHYKERLNDTLIFLNACQSFSPVATDLVDAVQGTGSVLFGWTETVRGVDAIAAAVALYEALSEWGYPAQVALDQIGELKVGEAVPGNSAPELRLSQRPDGGDLRIRDVVTLLNPGSGQVLTASDLVSIQGIQGDGIPDAAPYMLRVDGVKPELASGMTVHVSIDGSEGEPVPLTSGQVNEQDQWTVSGMLPLGYDLEEETAVTFRAWVNLHSGGESRHEASATLTGEEPIIMGTVWEFEAVHTIGYFDGTPHTTWGATTQLTLTFATGQPPTEPHPRYVVTGGSVTFDYNHTVLSCVHSAPVVTFEANPQTVSVDSEILFDTTTDPVGYSGKVFTAGPNVQVSIVCGGIVGGTVTLPTPSRWFEIEPEEGLLVSQDRRSISGTYREEDPQTGIYHETDYTITRVQ